MHTPTESDFSLLKRVLRYVKGTITLGISFNKDTDSTLRAYCDSDFAGCNITRRSTGGFCTFLGSNLISWSSKKQATVAKSSTEAEYRCLSDTASELAWFNTLLRELGIPQPVTPELYCDNLSAVHLSANPVFHARSKHFETHYHYVRERVALGSLIIKHVPAYHQLADIFTKSLPASAFNSLRFKLGVAFPTTPNLRGTINRFNTLLQTEGSKTFSSAANMLKTSLISEGPKVFYSKTSAAAALNEKELMGLCAEKPAQLKQHSLQQSCAEKPAQLKQHSLQQSSSSVPAHDDKKNKEKAEQQSKEKDKIGSAKIHLTNRFEILESATTD